MANNTNEEVTQVSQADVNIDELFALPGAENIMVPGAEDDDEKKPNMFSSTNVDTSFLDKLKPAAPAAKAATPAACYDAATTPTTTTRLV